MAGEIHCSGQQAPRLKAAGASGRHCALVLGNAAWEVTSRMSQIYPGTQLQVLQLNKYKGKPHKPGGYAGGRQSGHEVSELWLAFGKCCQHVPLF